MKGIGLAFLSMGSLLAGPNFDPVVRPVMEILDAILWAALGLIGAVGAIYCIEVFGCQKLMSRIRGNRQRRILLVQLSDF